MWNLASESTSVFGSAAPQMGGLSVGMFLAGLTSLVSGAVLLDPRASKGAKEIARIALSTSLPFVLNQAFSQNVWPLSLASS